MSAGDKLTVELVRLLSGRSLEFTGQGLSRVRRGWTSMRWLGGGLLLASAFPASAQRARPDSIRDTSNVARSAGSIPGELEGRAVRTLTDLLDGLAAAALVLNPSGTLGVAGVVRIRGQRSPALSNDPMLEIDGVRVPMRTAPLGGEPGDPFLDEVSLLDL